MLAKVRSAANWLLPLKIQAFPGDFGELCRHLETHHNMNSTKNARFQEAPIFPPAVFFLWCISHHCSGSLQNREGFGEPDIAPLEGWWFNLHLPGVDSSVSNGSIRKFFSRKFEASFRGCEIFRAEGLLLLLSEQFDTKCNKGINLQAETFLIWENTWKNFYNLGYINHGLSWATRKNMEGLVDVLR